jgi:hypothetical protein
MLNTSAASFEELLVTSCPRPESAPLLRTLRANADPRA